MTAIIPTPEQQAASHSHFVRAESLLEEAEREREDGGHLNADRSLAVAQVHALLAIAAVVS